MTPPGAPAASRQKTTEQNNTSEPARPLWTSRGYLPHFHRAQVQSITYRLADALPKKVVERLEKHLRELPEDQRKHQRRRRLEAYLDAGHGSCILSRPECARIIIENWQHFHDKRYHLHAWVIMPNHVHVIIQPFPEYSLDRILHSWKSFTSTAIGKLGIPGAPSAPLWQREYWDRFIRDEQHFQQAIAYIEANPVSAGLCATPEQWPWSSAHLSLCRLAAGAPGEPL